QPPWKFLTFFPELVSSTKYFYLEPDLEHDLINIYLQDFHPLVPILHLTTFYALHLTFRALCLLMLFVASRCASDPRVKLNMSSQQPIKSALPSIE
ncbi:hypothetical protein VP01_5276g1, partial [Puccinia sorghi]